RRRALPDLAALARRDGRGHPRGRRLPRDGDVGAVVRGFVIGVALALAATAGPVAAQTATPPPPPSPNPSPTPAFPAGQVAPSTAVPSPAAPSPATPPA